MGTTLMRQTGVSGKGNVAVPGPTWDIALLFPQQGQWDEEEFLALPVNHLVELSEGYLEFPPMPTPLHQWIVLLLYKLLDEFAWPKHGMTLVAPLPVRLWPGKESRHRDLVTKPKEYARAGISEYWIVDPRLERITVLTLKGKRYETAGVYGPGERAPSLLLPEFAVDVDAVFTEPNC
jgi:Putative restriction endonuclease